MPYTTYARAIFRGFCACVRACFPHLLGPLSNLSITFTTVYHEYDVHWLDLPALKQAKG